MGILPSYESISLDANKPDETVIPKRHGGESKPADNPNVLESEVKPKREYRPSTEIAPEQNVGGSSSSSTENSDENQTPSVTEVKTKLRVKQNGSDGTVKKPAARIRGDTVQIPRFSREVMDFVRNELPDALNNQDALAAYVFIKSGGCIDVPDDIRQIAATYNGDRTIQNMEQRMISLEKNVKTLTSLMYEIELALSSIIFDRYGFRRSSPGDPRSVDLLENGVLDIRERLREVTGEQRKRDNVKNGRPIR